MLSGFCGASHPMKRMLSIKRDRAFPVADLVIVLATAFLLVMVLPQLMHQPRRRSSRIHCMSNLKQIGVAMRLYASDNDGNYPAKGETKGSTNWGETYLHFKVAGNELSSPRVLICPDDKTRISAVDFSPTNFVGNSNVSYFVALDADATNPNLLLTGDRHLDLPRKTPVLNLARHMFDD